MPSPTEELLQALLDGVERELPGAVELRRRLHACPELAHQEVETSRLVSEALPVAPVAAAGTGLLARVGAAGVRPVAIRAELDGLPVQEQTGVEFSARGETMHACGHDVHMAAVVAVARAAEAMTQQLPVPLLAAFQPSEEAYPSGAKLLAEGALREQAPLAILAAHVHPELPWGSVALDPGPVNASFDAVEIEIVGRQTHGAYPHRGADPVLALSAVVTSLHALVGREVSPLHAATLTIATLQAGGADNVIPAVARARGALRAHLQEDRERLRAMVERAVTGVAAAYGCEGTVGFVAGEPPLENDEQIVKRARALLAESGMTLAPAWRSCGSDDFAFFGELCPVAMAFVGLEGAPGFAVRPLHHPELLPPDESVGAVARVLAAMYVAAARRSVEM
jgi:amidohydrolase